MKSAHLFLFVLAAPALLSAAEPLVVTKESAPTFYRGFKRLTAEPRLVAPLTATLCSIPTKAMLDKEKDMTGPHHKQSIFIYANDSAADSIAGKKKTFPVGAVIVKEKLGKDLNSVSGVGGMIKRAKGYDPANGDWEFFYSTPGGDFTTGKLANCIDCHNGGKRDHVFSVWDLASK